MEDIVLRMATKEDCSLLFEWRNDTECRNNSLTTEEIPYEVHCEWFQEMRSSDACDIFIGMLNNEPIGQIRINYAGSEGKISYSIKAEVRGQGYGKELLRLVEQSEVVRKKAKKLVAIVKASNIASQICFELMQYSKRSDGEQIYYYKQI